MADASAVDVSVVLPCLNEAESVGACVTAAKAALAGAGISGEVVVVDNGSTDGSPELAADAGARLVRESQRGYGSALRAGFAAARGEIVVMADADLTYDFAKIPDLLAPIQAGHADMVLGSRLGGATRQTMPFLHRFVGTPAITFLTARACGRRVVRDSQSGYRAFRRDAVAELDLQATGMELATEMLIRAARGGLRIAEVETGYGPRVGESKLSTFSDGWRHLQLVLLLAPDLLLVGPGLALFGLGLCCWGWGSPTRPASTWARCAGSRCSSRASRWSPGCRPRWPARCWRTTRRWWRPGCAGASRSSAAARCPDARWRPD